MKKSLFAQPFFPLNPSPKSSQLKILIHPIHAAQFGIAGVAIALATVGITEGAIAQTYDFGDSGDTVCRIQRVLGVTPVDCLYGLDTETAVRGFQQREGIRIDGIAGPETLALLGLTDQVVTRPITDTAIQSGAVTTQSGIGLNVRTCPGLSCARIYGAAEREWLELTDAKPVSRDGYIWRQVPDGNWVATEYLSPIDGRLVSVSAGGDSVSVPGSGTAVPDSSRIGPYVVVVPGGSATKLAQVRRYAPGAYQDASLPGKFINAGGYSNYNFANALSSRLRGFGFDARVAYRP